MQHQSEQHNYGKNAENHTKPMPTVETIAFALGMAGVGLLLTYVGVHRLKLWRAIKQHPEKPPETVQPGDTALITGTAVPYDSHTAPVTGEEAVATRYWIETLEMDDQSSATNWETIEQENIHDTFFLSDDKRIRVHPEITTPDLAFTDDAETAEKVTAEEVADKGGIPFALDQMQLENMIQQQLRHRQQTVKVGDDVAVFATVESDENGELVATRGDDTGFFYVMDDVSAVANPVLYFAVVGFGLLLTLTGVLAGLGIV